MKFPPKMNVAWGGGSIILVVVKSFCCRQYFVIHFESILDNPNQSLYSVQLLVHDLKTGKADI